MKAIAREESKSITVIIPCFNVSAYLDRCWNSLLRQTMGISNIQCVFVNDCSTDGGKTIGKLKNIECYKPDSVTIINLEENVGPGEARNIGLQYADGQFIQFLDADDELDDNALKVLYELAEENQTDIIQYNHMYILGDQRRSSGDSMVNKLYVIENKEDRIPFLNASTVTYACTNKFIRRNIIQLSGAKFPARTKYEEPLFIYPLFLYANRIYLLNADLYLYYFRPNSMVTSELGEKLLDHPKVQLMLLEYFLSRSDICIEYKDVFEIYFLWSFFLETISFAGNNKDVVLPVEYFRYMQEVCKNFCGNWRNNPLIYMIPKDARKALESIDRNFMSQKELNEFVGMEKNKF